MVNRNVHLQQIAAVLDLDIDMLRTLNPQYRRDVVPGFTKPSPIKMSLNDVTRFIDNQDSIYNYNASELLNKRYEVAVNDDAPTFVSKKKKTTARRKTTTKRKKTTAKRKTTTKRKTTARKKTTAKKSTAKKKTTSRKKKR